VVTQQTAPATTGKPVTIITQTRVRPGHDEDFTRWQQQISAVIAGFPGFVDHQIIPPDPPSQVDWVIVQKFASSEQAQAWLQSEDRLHLLESVQPILVGHDDIHLITDDNEDQPSSTVSAVISMQVKPEGEEAYREWGQRIAAAQAQFPGFLGFKQNAPIPGVQDDWVTILTFDTEPHLNAWMTSPQRQRLIDEASAFSGETHYRTVRSGFEQWFRTTGSEVQAPVWKQNMLTLLALYPVVFLFGFFVMSPLLMKLWGWPFYFALFTSNVAGVLILNYLVPWVSRQFTWWLAPAGGEMERRDLIGVTAVIALYILLLVFFSRFPLAL